jgi:glycosyltransferase involved in cell wall biosynthesis
VRILYFTRDYSPHDHRFLTALARTEHEIFSLRLERQRIKREERPLPGEIEHIVWKGGRGPVSWHMFPALVQDLKQVLHRFRPDVVHAGTIQTSAFLTALAGFKPLVTMSWGSDLLKDAERSVWMRWATQFTLDRTSVLVGDCQAVQDKAAQFNFPKKRTVIFPWGVDLEHFQPGDSMVLTQLGWEDCFVLLSLRSWEPIYGVDVLLKAFIRAARIAPQLRLILLGGGSQKDMLQTLIAESGLEDRVHMGGLTGFRELPDYYRACDLYVSASYSDGSSVSLMESLACARPVLVSDIPGNREWIDEGEQGWFFPPGDEDALSTAILRAYDQRMRLARMAHMCRRRAEERADWNKNFQKLLAAYESAVYGIKRK